MALFQTMVDKTGFLELLQFLKDGIFFPAKWFTIGNFLDCHR